MTTPLKEDLLKSFDQVKDDDEEILWIDKPKFIPYAITGIEAVIGIVVFVAVSYGITKAAKSDDENFNRFSLWVLGLPVALILWQFLSKIFAFSNTSYAYSTKRAMIRSGFIGKNFKSVDYDKISDIEVTVNIVERIFKVGTVRFFSGRTEINDGITSKLYDRWEAISNPYEVFKQLKKVTVDIKTDFNYPNALRPEINPGYNSKYRPRQ